LCPLLETLGHEVFVYQCAARHFKSKHGNAEVIGIPVQPGKGMPNEKVVRHFRKIARKNTGTKERVEIFAADFFAVKNNNPLAICIQNGLAWDSDITLLTPRKMHHTPLGEKLFRYRCQLRGLRRFETCYNRVAVDLYFLNWYRSFRGPSVKGRLFYNPNPAPAAHWDPNREMQITSDEPLKIIFARRFAPEKGTRMIAAVFKRLLRIRPNIEITLAGEGPDDRFLNDVFSDERRVTITSYEVEDALKVHRNHDIAVIPSLCGEATCLSVLEAMAAGCAIIATNMGGTITEIIDSFNGILCWPTEDSVLESFLKLIDAPEERLRIQKWGWETSQKSFGLEMWKNRWTGIIGEIIDGKCYASKIMKRK
jgi:glycosyltransferase involved in cell wall biosynthesis